MKVILIILTAINLIELGRFILRKIRKEKNVAAVSNNFWIILSGSSALAARISEEMLPIWLYKQSMVSILLFCSAMLTFEVHLFLDKETPKIIRVSCSLLIMLIIVLYFLHRININLQ